MAARAECPPHSLRNSHPQERRRLALFVCAAIMVAAVGVLGLEKASWLRQLVESWINIHLLFGLLLCGLVLVRYQWFIRDAPHLHEDIRELSRHLSRIVYLMLYAVIGVRLGISLLNWIWHGGSLDLTVLDEGLRNDDDSRVINPHHDYHMILLSGGITLGMVRVFLTGCLVRRSRGE
jgi:cytochrome b561